jgi:hypothetical protein
MLVSALYRDGEIDSFFSSLLITFATGLCCGCRPCAPPKNCALAMAFWW